MSAATPSLRVDMDGNEITLICGLGMGLLTTHPVPSELGMRLYTYLRCRFRVLLRSQQLLAGGEPKTGASTTGTTGVAIAYSSCKALRVEDRCLAKIWSVSHNLSVGSPSRKDLFPPLNSLDGD